TLVALEWLSAMLCGADLKQTHQQLQKAAPAVESYIGRYRTHVENLVAKLQGIRHVFVAGRGASLATAGTGGLILKESAHFPAEGMSAAAFRHGPFEMLGPHIFLLVFSGDGISSQLNRRLVDDVCSAGGRAALVSEDGEEEVFRLPRVAP